MASRPTVVVTGCQGKVGRYVTQALAARGVRVVGVDLVRGVYDTFDEADGFPETYIQADLASDAAAAFSCISRFQPVAAVVHVAAIPDPQHNPPHVVFQTNIMSTFNVVEACVRLKVPRLVNVSSEQVPGFFASERVVPGVSGLPAYCPVDEKHPIAPQNPYALSKHFGEQLCDAAIRRAEPGTLTIVSIRPSWCQGIYNMERNIGPLVRDASLPNEGMWAYICIPDLAEALALAALTPARKAGDEAAAADGSGSGGLVQGTHEVIYIAAADNAGGKDLAAAVKAHYGDAVPVRSLPRPDASSIDCSKAKAVLGWVPKYSWRDYLDATTGKLLPHLDVKNPKGM